MMKGSEHLLYGDRRKEPGWLSPKGEASGASYEHYVSWGRREDGAGLLSEVSCDGTRGNAHSVRHRKICPDIANPFFCCRDAQTLERVAQRAVKLPSLDIFKTPLGQAVGNRQ